ncbi:CocE/NonD family hydrolase [Pedococcus sp. 5OH_020]|uniref:CocE/NonD family hydrolase n=1 Tax=Pedococcus sp. 5OH_020 TaxID=2989814 RepID=UPI0022E9A57D|nr:CocE/NonD family hydrolase [Pedococcus sp. 5OH_020]
MAGAVIEYDVEVRMRDGVLLRADVYRPMGDGPWPVIVARTPYDRLSSIEILHLDPWAAVRRGFITVVQDTRGRYASEGDGPWKPFVGEDLDGADTIEWAATLPGSSGRVGMWGMSYLGNAQWQAASQQPPSLRAIVPTMTWRDPDDGLAARGGAEELGLNTFWGLLTGFDVVAREHSDDELRRAERLASMVDDFDHLASRTYWELLTAIDPVLDRHGAPSLTRPDARAAAQAADLVDQVQVPSLNIGGWFDVFLQGTIDNFLEISDRVVAKLVIGPWQHVSQAPCQGEADFGVASDGSSQGSTAWIPGMAFDWLQHQLSTDAAGTGGQPVQIFVMGANEWRYEAEWPPARAVDTAYFLAADGSLGSRDTLKPGSRHYAYDPRDPVPTCGGATLMAGFPAGVFDQARVESRDDVVVFTSEVLVHDVEVTGRVSATLTVESDAPTCDWVVRLCDVHPDGRSYNVTDGITRLLMEPGVAQDVGIDLWSTSMVFAKGHRIRVQVTSSCFPRWDRNLNTLDGRDSGAMKVATQTIHLGQHTGSFITLPVVPG